MRYSPKKEEEDKWEKYDLTRMQSQKNTINELENQIKQFQKRERAFLVHMHLKDKQIQNIKRDIKELIRKQRDSTSENKTEIMLDPLLYKEFKLLKSLLQEKDEKIFAKDNELMTLQTIQAK